MFVCVRTLYHTYLHCENAQVFRQSHSHILNIIVQRTWYALKPSCSWSEALGIVDIAPLCLKVTREAKAPPQTTEEKNIEWSTEQDRACHAAETAEQEDIDWVNKIDQGMLLM